MSAPSHLLYLLACANLDEPDAGWTIDGNGLVSASGDRISVMVRFHGYTAAIRRAGFRQVGVGHAEQLGALWDRMRDAARVRA